MSEAAVYSPGTLHLLPDVSPAVRVGTRTLEYLRTRAKGASEGIPIFATDARTGVPIRVTVLPGQVPVN